jgi:hypothetical protein
MANEFKHKDPGAELTSAEFIASDGTGHIFDSQATGDVLYASSTTALARLGVATNGNVLELSSGLPAWTSTPTIGSTSWSNANHAHAATNSGGSAVGTTVTVTDNESTDESNLVAFVADAGTSTGNHGLEMDGNLNYNPSTGRLTATQLTGTLQTASQTNITGVGTIDTGVWEGTTVAVAQGGIGATTLTDKAVLISQDSGTDTVGTVAITSSGQIIIGGASGPAAATITAGTNVTITNGDGSISIAASGGGIPNPFFFS